MIAYKDFSTAHSFMPDYSYRVLSLAFIFCAAMLAGCSPVRLMNALVPSGDYDVHRAIPYESGERRELDVYVPKQSTTTQGARPMVVFFYGGSWQTGNRRDYLFVGEALASRGIVTVIPDYRLYPDAIFPAFIDDAASAVAWARAHATEYGADPNRIYLMGHSAGAQIVMLMTTDRHYLADKGVDTATLAGAIGLAGPYDFLPLKDDTLKEIFPANVRATSQPINHVSGDEPPIFLGVGTSDVTVDPGNTFRFAARLESKNDRVELKQYAGVNHAMIVGSLGKPLRKLSPLITVAPVLDDVIGFIRTTEVTVQRF